MSVFPNFINFKRLIDFFSAASVVADTELNLPPEAQTYRSVDAHAQSVAATLGFFSEVNPAVAGLAYSAATFATGTATVALIVDVRKGEILPAAADFVSILGDLTIQVGAGAVMFPTPPTQFFGRLATPVGGVLAVGGVAANHPDTVRDAVTQIGQQQLQQDQGASAAGEGFWNLLGQGASWLWNGLRSAAGGPSVPPTPNLQFGGGSVSGSLGGEGGASPSQIPAIQMAPITVVVDRNSGELISGPVEIDPNAGTVISPSAEVPSFTNPFTHQSDLPVGASASPGGFQDTSPAALTPINYTLGTGNLSNSPLLFALDYSASAPSTTLSYNDFFQSANLASSLSGLLGQPQDDFTRLDPSAPTSNGSPGSGSGPGPWPMFPRSEGPKPPPEPEYGGIDYNGGYYGPSVDGGGYGGGYGSPADFTSPSPGTPANDPPPPPPPPPPPSGGDWGGGGWGDGGWDDGGWDGGWGGGGWGGGGWGGDFPVVLDLTGGGIHITPLSSSNIFMDMSNDGHEQHTAWAGAGNGVLVYDPNGGAVTQANQFEFTLWDPSAKTDMQALANVFDNDHDGTLSSSDASWSSFRILVTNADGTTTLETLAQAGVTSINLTPNAYQRMLPDGSSISSETTFTRSNGTTGTAASATFAAASTDYSVQQTVTLNGDGSTTLSNSAYGLDGTLAEKIVTATSADGHSRTTTYDWNGDGVVDQIQSDVTAVNADGSTTETLRDVNGTGVLMDQTKTVTSANGSTVTISRDTAGAGYVDQQEVDATDAGGSTSVAVSELTRNGSLIGQTVSTVSASGLSRTAAADTSGSGYFDRIETDQTVVAANGTRSETVTVSNADSSLRGRTVTTTSANGLSVTTQTDAAGSGVYNRTTADTTVINTDGSRTTTRLDQSSTGAVTDRTVTTISADGNSTTTQIDQVGTGAFNATKTDAIAFNAAGDRTETITQAAADGAIYEKQVSVRNADGRTGSVQTYIDSGYGLALTQSDMKTVNAAGALVETVIQYSPNGAITGETISTTSPDGLTQSTQQDPSGGGVFDFTAAITTTKNDAGASVTTKTGTAVNGARIGQTVTTASADGTSTVIQEDNTGSGTYDTTLADTKTQNADGSVSVVVATASANGTLQGRKTTLTSADRTTVTATTANGDGETVVVETAFTAANGTVTDTVADYAPNGTLVDQTVTIKSANGLSRATETDANGLANSSILTTADVTVLNANGSRTRTVTDTGANGTVIDRTVTTTSANGLASMQTANVDGKVDFTTTDAILLNADGSQTETLRKTSASSALIQSTVVTTSGNGLSVVTGTDINGDGVIDRTRTDVTVLNADGSTTETVSDVEGANGALLDRMATITSASGVSKIIDRDLAGRGFFDQVETIAMGVDGSVSDTVANYGSTGQQLDETTTTTSANELVVATAADINGDGVFDRLRTATTSYSLDGSKTVVTSLQSGATVGQTTVTTTSANGLATTSVIYGSTGIAESASTDVRMLDADGSTIETVSQYSGSGAPTARTTTTMSSDGKTTTVQTSADGGPQNTKVATSVERSDGSVVVTASIYAAGAALTGKTVRTTAANKLSWTETADTNGDGLVDDTQSDAIVLNVDGSTTETFSDVRANGVSGTTVVTTKSANGLSETIATTGSIKSTTDSNTLTDTTTINNDGSTTEVRTIVSTSGSGGAWSKESVQTTANRLLQTTTLSEASDAVTDYTDQLVTNADGSTAQTTTILHRNGSAFETDVLTTSSNHLSTSLQSARNGSATFNHFETKVENSDGSKTDTVWDTNGSGTTTGEVVTTISGNGLAKQVQVLPTGASVVISTTDVTKPIADGSTTEVLSKFGGTGELLSRQARTTSADGLIVTTTLDANGDGVVDKTTYDEIDMSEDGSRGERIWTYYEGWGAGDFSQTSTSANGLIVTTWANFDTEYVTDVKTTDLSGAYTETTEFYADPFLPLASSVNTVVSADGASKVVTSKDSSGNVTQVETTTVQADANGTYNWLLQNGSGTTLDQATHLIDANGVDHVALSIGGQAFQATLTVVQEATVQSQVARLFNTILDRAPTATESELTLKYYSSSGLDLATMTGVMLSSSEFTTKYGTLTNLEFVEQIYQNALGRSPSLGELSSWLGQLSAGTATRANLADTVSESAEHVANGNVYQETNDSYSPYGTWTPSHTVDAAQARTIVGRLYLATLGRVADSAGLATYSLDLFNAVLTPAGIASALLGTSEFASKFGGLAPSTLVSDVFINALGRPPSQAEQQYWTGALSAGTVTTADFVMAVALSPDGGSVIDNGNGTEQRFVYNLDASGSGGWAYSDQLWQKATTTSATQSVSSDDWVSKSTTTSQQVWVSSGYWTSDESGTYWVDTSSWQTQQVTTTSMVQQVDAHTHTVVTQHDSAELSVTTVNNNGTSTTTPVSSSPGDQPWTTIVQTYENGNLLDTITTNDSGMRSIAISRAAGADVLAVSGTDTVTFASNIAYNQMWFNKTGNDLVISVIGQSETMTLSNWFLGAADQPATIVTGDGYTLTAAGIQSLVQAMAGQAIPMSGTNGSAFVASPTLALAADTGSSGTDKITANGQLNVSGLASGATWQYSLDSGTTWVTGTGTAIAASVFTADGAKIVQVRQTDANGNISAAASLSFVLETSASAPTLALVADTGASSTDQITSNGQVRVSSLASGATWQYRLAGTSTWLAGTGTSIAASAFGADGIKTVQVQQTDGAGSVSSITSFSFTLDTSAAAPVLALAADTGSSDGITRNGQVNVSGLASEATWQYSLDGGTSWMNGTSTSIAASAFGADGTKSVQVRQTDIAGNMSPTTSFSFTLDTAPPTAPSLVLAADSGISATDGITNDGQVDVLGLASGDAWQFSLNGGATWTAGTGTSIGQDSFGADGTKSVEARQIDGADNVSAIATLGFTLDTATPVLLSLSGGTPALVVESSAIWEYGIDGSYQPGAGNSVELTAGAHTWSIVQSDAAGNVITSDYDRFIVGSSSMGQVLTGTYEEWTFLAGETFLVGRNSGSDTINAGANFGGDALALGPTINHDQLWFSQTGSDLTIGVIGQNETLTVAGWYSSASDQLNKIVASDGYAIDATGVQEMVQAMTSFNQPAAGQTTLPETTAASLAPAMAAAWTSAPTTLPLAVFKQPPGIGM